MSKALLIQLLLFSSLSMQLFAQDWPKTYTGAYASWLTESYDNGYFIAGPKNTYKYGMIFKTDINGDLLWKKTIGNGQGHWTIRSIEMANDSGFIISGSTKKYTYLGDPFIIKFNTCGEMEWCTVIKLGGTDDYSKCAKVTPTNEYVLLTIYSDPNPNHHTQLYKFDSTGALIWRQDYPTQGNAFEDTPRNLRIDSSTYLISGDCYYPDPGHPGGFERPYYICTDTAGNVNWRLVYGAGNGFHGMSFYSPIKSNSGYYYDIALHSNYCDTPALIRFSESGEESYFQDVLPGSCPGGASTPNWLDGSTITLKVIGIINGNEILKWIKIDTLGIEKTSSYFTELWMRYTFQSILTKDRKLASRSSNGSSTIYFYKLNTDLEFDSIYTMPRTYDSLCPYQIVTDTVDPDCGLIVSIKDPEEYPELYRLKVYPNPATNKVTVEVPEFLQKLTGPAGFQATTVYHQWGSATLEVFDLFGRMVMKRLVLQADRTVEVDVSMWKRGMYVFRLNFRGECIATEKVVIN